MLTFKDILSGGLTATYVHKAYMPWDVSQYPENDGV